MAPIKLPIINYLINQQIKQQIITARLLHIGRLTLSVLQKITLNAHIY